MDNKLSLLLVVGAIFLQGVSGQDFSSCDGPTELLTRSNTGTFSDRLASCQGLGGTIKSFRDVSDYQQVASSLSPGTSFYVGIQSNGAPEISTNKFISFDGNDAGIDFVTQAGIGNFPWDPSQPDSDVDGCVVISGDSQLLSDVECEEPHGIICEIPNSPTCAQPQPDQDFEFCIGSTEQLYTSTGGTFDERQIFCGSLGGELKTFDDQNDFFQISDNLPPNSNKFYVGIISNGGNEISTLKFLSLDGNNVGIDFVTQAGIGNFPWDFGQPDSPSDNCVVLSADSRLLSDVNCNELHGAVCEIPNSPKCDQGPPPPPAAELCFNDELVQIISAPATFNEAINSCINNFGANLYSVSSKVKIQGILELNSQLGNSDFWIGIRFIGEDVDPSDPVNFEFVDGNQPGAEFFQVSNGEFPWSSGEPSGFECVKIDGSSGLFVTADCGEQHPFVCSSPVNCGDGRVIPDEWNCFPSLFNRGDGCHCSCGVQDPDCESGFFQQLLNCDGDANKCINAECVNTVPPEWTCDRNSFDSGDGCDCDCGALDPDCDSPDQQVRNCRDGAECIDGNCVGGIELPSQVACFENTLYAYYSNPTDFTVASQNCRAFNKGVLPSPRSADLMSLFGTLSADSIISEMMVGLILDNNTEFSAPEDFLPTDSAAFGNIGIEFFQNANTGEFPWAPSEPNGTPDDIQQCVSYNRDTNTLSDSSCIDNRPFMCALPGVCAESIFAATCVGNETWVMLGQSGNFSRFESLCTSDDFAGRLVSIVNRDELEQIQAMLQISNFTGSFWVGITAPNGNSGDPLDFSFADGSTDGLDFIHTAVGEFPWDVNQPNGDGETNIEDCVVIDVSTGLLSDIDCNEIHFGICILSEKEGVCQPINETLAATVVPTAAPIPEASVLPTQQPTSSPTSSPLSAAEGIPTQIMCVDNNFHSYFSQPQNFETAKQICQNFNRGELSSPRNIKHLEVFSSMSRVSKLTEMWVGISLNPNTLDSNPVEFLPIDGRRIGFNGIDFFQNTLVGEFPWATGEPNGTPENPQQCVSYNRETNALSDDVCEERKPFVCIIPDFCGGVGATCVGKNLYQLNPSIDPYDTYLSNCQLEGDIRNAEQLRLVHDSARLSGLDTGEAEEIWVGINAPNGSFGDPLNFVFSNGKTAGLEFIQTAPGIFPWAPNEPDGGGDGDPQDCAVVDLTSGLLRDISCNEARLGFCKSTNNRDLCQKIDESLQGTLAPSTSTPTLSPEPPTPEPTRAPSVSPTTSPTVTDPAPECRAKVLGVRRPFKKDIKVVPSDEDQSN